MSTNPINKLETQLETMTEGAFARLLRRTVSARDIATLLLRAMEENAAPAPDSGAMPIAPDAYTIHLHPDNVQRFRLRFPDLPQILAGFIVELSGETGFQLAALPRVSLHADERLSAERAAITAKHSQASRLQTEKMHAVTSRDHPLPLQNARLIIDGDRAVPLNKPVINIGREEDNDIVIADEFISRQHLQLRKRQGTYALFDVKSSGGTRVNNTAVSEHQLQTGDVIRIGHTEIIFTADKGNGVTDNTTQVLRPD